jgi:hypothetical protein
MSGFGGKAVLCKIPRLSIIYLLLRAAKKQRQGETLARSIDTLKISQDFRGVER